MGGAIGVAVAALLWPPNPVSRLRQEFREASRKIKSDILQSLELAGRGEDSEAQRRQVRSNSERVDSVVAEILPAEDALRWNPWHSARMQDLSRLEDGLRLISYLYRTVRALARLPLARRAPIRHSLGVSRRSLVVSCSSLSLTVLSFHCSERSSVLLRSV